MEEILASLTRADRKLSSGDFDGAENEYRSALDQSEKEHLNELANRASEGIKQARRARSRTSELSVAEAEVLQVLHNTGGDQARLRTSKLSVAEVATAVHTPQQEVLLNEYRSADSDERRILSLRCLIDDSFAQLIDSQTTHDRYVALLSILRTRMLQDARELVDKGRRKLEEALNSSVLTDVQRAEVIANYFQAGEIIEGKKLDFPTDNGDASVHAAIASIRSDLRNDGQLDSINEEIRQLRNDLPKAGHVVSSRLATSTPSEPSSAPPSKAIVAPASTPPSGRGRKVTTTKAASDATLSSQQRESQHAEALVARAEVRLRRPTTASYKEAIDLIKEALSMSVLDAEQRVRIQIRLAEVEQNYTTFRDRFGQLVTARQIDQAEEELIVTLMLMNAGAQDGPDGENLADKYNQVSKKLRDDLLRVASERVALADRHLINGRDFLDLGPMQAAQKCFDEAMTLLNGEQIGDLSGQITSERRTAILGVRKTVSELLRRDHRLSDYEARKTEVERATALIERVKPIYTKAEAEFNNRRYIQAWILVGQMKSTLGNDFASQTVETLNTRATTAREDELSAELQVIAEQAQSALANMQISKVEEAVSKALLLDPQFKTTLINAKRDEIRSLLEQVRSIERQIATLLGQARDARSKRDWPSAAADVRRALTIRPDSTDARELLDNVLYDSALDTFTGIERELEKNNIDSAQITVLKDLLGNDRPLIEELSDPQIKRRVHQMAEDLRERINKLVDETGKKEAQRDKLENALRELERNIKIAAFETANGWLQTARELTSSQNPRLVRLETELRTTWGDDLRRRTRQALDASPSKPTEAIDLLNSIDERGLANEESLALRRRAERLLARQEGLAACDRGDFSTALDWLSKADLDNPETLVLLNQTQRKEVNRLAGVEDWEKMLAMILRMDSGEQSLAGLVRRGRGELALRAFVEHLREKRFADGEIKLNEALAQRLPDINERVIGLRDELNGARTLYQRIEARIKEAEELKDSFDTNRNRKQLLEAIKVLNQALADSDLRPGDRQRESVQKLREEYLRIYQQLITSERLRLLGKADVSLRDNDVASALTSFREVLEIMPSAQDPEASAGVERSRQKLVELRAKQVEDVERLLNLRRGGQLGVIPIEITRTIAKVEQLRNIEGDIVDSALNKALRELQEAERLCQQADSALNEARKRWGTLRNESLSGGTLDHQEIDGDINRGIGFFSDKTYIHIELDRTSLESVSARIGRDLADLKDAQNAVNEFRRGMGHEQRNSDELLSVFNRLSAIEERLYKSTLKLIEHDRVASVARPSSTNERYPRQAALVRSLREEVERLKGDEKTIPDLPSLRALMIRRAQSEELLRRLDPDQRFRA
ncbi:MAG: hypothetical protein WCI67_00060 [Chloroflexales bacterium]